MDTTSPIITELLSHMQNATAEIQRLAHEAGFTGDPSSGREVVEYLSDTAFDIQRYAVLSAESIILGMGNVLIQRHGNDTERAESNRLAAFDYNSNW